MSYLSTHFPLLITWSQKSLNKIMWHLLRKLLRFVAWSHKRLIRNQQNCLNLLWHSVPCSTQLETVDRIAANYYQTYKSEAKKFPYPLPEQPEPVDLINKPELAQNHFISAAITVDGMLHGRFRNKKLSDFDVPEQPDQPTNRYEFLRHAI